MARRFGFGWPLLLLLLLASVLPTIQADDQPPIPLSPTEHAVRCLCCALLCVYVSAYVADDTKRHDSRGAAGTGTRGTTHTT